MIELLARPDLGRVSNGLVVAAMAGIVAAAALELDRDDVELAGVMDAASLLINRLSKHGHGV